MFCMECGHDVGSAKFCVQCGAAIGAKPQTSAGAAPPAVSQAPANTNAGMRRAHEVEFKIYGEDLQFVEIMLDPGETIVAEAGAMMYMDSAVQMETIFGDGSGKEGKDLMGKLFSAGKRVITGESLFMTAFTNKGSGKKCVSFAAPYPGKVVSFDLTDVGGMLICQKDSFLCAAKGISVGMPSREENWRGPLAEKDLSLQAGGRRIGLMHAGGTMLKKTCSRGL